MLPHVREARAQQMELLVETIYAVSYTHLDVYKRQAYAPGGTFTVVAHGNSPSNVYIQRAVLNGREHTASHIDFADMLLRAAWGPRPTSRFGMPAVRRRAASAACL